MAGTYAIFSAVRIRDAARPDAAAMVAIYAPVVEQNAVRFEEIVPTEDEFPARIETGSSLHPWLVAELHGEVAGYAYASPHRKRAAYRWCVEVSVYVDRKFHRAGIGGALYQAL